MSGFMCSVIKVYEWGLVSNWQFSHRSGSWELSGAYSVTGVKFLISLIFVNKHEIIRLQGKAEISTTKDI